MQSRLFVSTPLRLPSAPRRAPSVPHVAHFMSVSDAIDAMTQAMSPLRMASPINKPTDFSIANGFSKLKLLARGQNRYECAHKINEEATSHNNQQHMSSELRRPDGRIVALANKMSMPSILRRRRPSFPLTTPCKRDEMKKAKVTHDPCACRLVLSHQQCRQPQVCSRAF